MKKHLWLVLLLPTFAIADDEEVNFTDEYEHLQAHLCNDKTNRAAQQACGVVEAIRRLDALDDADIEARLSALEAQIIVYTDGVCSTAQSALGHEFQWGCAEVELPDPYFWPKLIVHSAFVELEANRAQYQTFYEANGRCPETDAESGINPRLNNGSVIGAATLPDCKVELYFGNQAYFELNMGAEAAAASSGLWDQTVVFYAYDAGYIIHACVVDGGGVLDVYPEYTPDEDTGTFYGLPSFCVDSTDPNLLNNR